MSLVEKKRQLRVRMKNLLNSHSSNDLSTFSLKINTQILKLIETNNWRKIGLFASTDEEPNIWQIFESEEVQFFFPRINSRKNIELCEVRFRADLVKGQYDILEPSKESPKIDPSTLDVIFIPGLAFDQGGNRLGHGKGYYDRLLTTLPQKVVKVGVCFPFQVIDKVPHDENDKAMNIIVY